MNIIQAVNTCLYARLATDTALQEHGSTGVFVLEVPLNQPMPYVVIDTGTYVPFDAFQQEGWDGTVMVYIWSDLYDGGAYENMVSDVLRLLHHPKDGLQIPDFTSVSSECEWMTVVDNAENNTRHVPMRIRLVQQ